MAMLNNQRVYVMVVMAIDKNRDDQNYDWGDQIFDESAQNDCYHERNPAQIKYSYHNP